MDYIKQAPHNLDAEKAVIGSVFINNQVIDSLVEIIKPEDFYSKSNEILFKTMLLLREKNHPIDLLTISDFLKKTKELDKVGGITAISSIIDEIPSAANVIQYAKIVKEKSIIREVIGTCTEVIESCYNEPEEIDEFLDNIEKKFFELSENRFDTSFTNIKSLIWDAMATIESIYKNKSTVSGVPSGFYKLDEMTNGFQPSDLIIVAGRPSMGKTALCLNIAAHIGIEKKIPVAFFSLEMSKEQLAYRLISSETGISSNQIRNGMIPRSDWARLSTVAGNIAEGKLFIDDTPAMTILEIRAKARRLKAQEDIQIVIIDYLQLVRGLTRTDSREREISEISRSLKNLARELKIPVIALSQLNRGVEMRSDRRPQLSDLRESGAIEQDADVILFIYRDEVYHKDKEDNKGTAELIIGKQRNGPTGKIDLLFDKHTTTFKNLAKDDEIDFIPYENNSQEESFNVFDDTE
jgi:replicative DNA helicase